MSVIQDKVRGLLVSLEGETLLVPNVAVAEVLPYSELDSSADGPDWLRGFLDWRGYRLPVVSIEVVHGHAAPAIDKHSRIAVLNTVKGDGGISFYAILTRGIPHLARLGDEDIAMAGAFDEAASGELARVQVNSQRAIIPDLEALETLVEEVA